MNGLKSPPVFDSHRCFKTPRNDAQIADRTFRALRRERTFSGLRGERAFAGFRGERASSLGLALGKGSIPGLARRETILAHARGESILRLVRGESILELAREESILWLVQRENILGLARKVGSVGIARKVSILGPAQKENIVGLARKRSILGLARGEHSRACAMQHSWACAESAFSGLPGLARGNFSWQARQCSCQPVCQRKKIYIYVCVGQCVSFINLYIFAEANVGDPQTNTKKTKKLSRLPEYSSQSIEIE